MRRFASHQVRNIGTIGGNIANGSPIGDTPPALIALGATLVLQNGAATRTLPLEDFFIAYGKQDRGPGEFVRAVIVPKPGQTIDFAAMVDFLKAQKLAVQYVPEKLIIRDAMPATPSGKIQKFRLREQLPETAGYTVADHVTALSRHGVPIDVVLLDDATTMPLGEPGVELALRQFGTPLLQQFLDARLGRVDARALGAPLLGIELAQRLEQFRDAAAPAQEARLLVFEVGCTRGRDEGRARLETMVRTNNGFEIAETDLQLRGPGEFFGTRQSGELGFHVANPLRDRTMLELARQEAFALATDAAQKDTLQGILRMLPGEWQRRYHLARIG